MYKKLADIYDYLVQGIDYEDWADYIEKLMERNKIKANSIADLACGTGNTSLPLALRGYKVYGIDLAPAMLDKAKQKAENNQIKVTFMEQDMRDLKLPEKVDVIVCYHDGLNYLLTDEDLKKVFTRVRENLKPDSLFIFDLNRVEKLARHTGTDTTFIDEKDMSLIYESNYEQKTDIWEITLTGFVRQGNLFDKFVETHKEKAHTQEDAVQFLKETGFELLDIYTAFTFEPPKPEARRLFYIARKQ